MIRQLAKTVALTLAMALPATARAQDTTDHAALRERALGVLETQFGAFQGAAHALAEASAAHCDGTLDRDGYLRAFRSTWLAWAPLDAYQFGPVEQHAAVLSIGFWPDKKDFVGRGLNALTVVPAEAQADPTVVAGHSAAAQGLPAIERLMFDDAYSPCPAIIGISGHIAELSDRLYADWFDAEGWADLARAAGPDNPVYLDDAEFTKALYTAVDFELTRIADTRLGRPLGTFDAPQPTWAEAWRSGISLDIIDAQLKGIRFLLERGFDGAIFNPNRTYVQGVIDETRARLGKIGAPLDVAVSDPTTRIRVEGLQTAIRYLQLQFAQDIGPDLGVKTGFSPADGD